MVRYKATICYQFIIHCNNNIKSRNWQVYIDIKYVIADFCGLYDFGYLYMYFKCRRIFLYGEMFQGERHPTANKFTWGNRPDSFP